MADINHHTALAEVPVEGDGIHYRGIVWFVVVLVVTTLVSAGLMVLLLNYLQHDAEANGVKRSPLAAPVGQLPPGPNLLTDEPSNLKPFREGEEKKLNTYQWIDKNAGTVRLPIDRAKELLLQKGLPVAGATPVPAATASKPEIKK
jgi:hypothetical protein